MIQTNFHDFYKSKNDALLEIIRDLLQKNQLTKKIFEQDQILYKETHDNNSQYIKLKYRGDCKFDADWKYACRGSTFIINNNEIIPYSCFIKFFNEHEFINRLGISFDEVLECLVTQGYKFLYMVKYDGSCVHCFTDKFGTRHRYTLGCIEKNNIGDSNYNYSDLTEQLLKEQFPLLYDYLDNNVNISLICEIITPHNQIKTEYTFNNCNLGFIKPIALIGSNGIPTWTNLYSLTNLFDNNVPNDSWNFNVQNYNSVKNEIFEILVNNPDKYGVNPEGLVAYCYKDNICFPIAKLKRTEYVSFINENCPTELCKLQLAKINNIIDDIPLSKVQQEHIDDFSNYLIFMSSEFNKYNMLGRDLDMKAFSLLVAELPPHFKHYISSLFQFKKMNYKPGTYLDGYILLIDILKYKIKNETNLEIIQKKVPRTPHLWYK